MGWLGSQEVSHGRFTVPRGAKGRVQLEGLVGVVEVETELELEGWRVGDMVGIQGKWSSGDLQEMTTERLILVLVGHFLLKLISR